MTDEAIALARALQTVRPDNGLTSYKRWLRLCARVCLATEDNRVAHTDPVAFLDLCER